MHILYEVQQVGLLVLVLFRVVFRRARVAIQGPLRYGYFGKFFDLRLEVIMRLLRQSLQQERDADEVLRDVRDLGRQVVHLGGLIRCVQRRLRLLWRIRFHRRVISIRHRRCACLRLGWRGLALHHPHAIDPVDLRVSVMVGARPVLRPNLHVRSLLPKGETLIREIPPCRLLSPCLVASYGRSRQSR